MKHSRSEYLKKRQKKLLSRIVSLHGMVYPNDPRYGRIKRIGEILSMKRSDDYNKEIDDLIIGMKIKSTY